MNLEDLAELSGDKLKFLSDAELVEILKPYFEVTRPELAPKKQQGLRQETLQLSPEKRAALAMLAESGVDLSFLRKKKR